MSTPTADAKGRRDLYLAAIPIVISVISTAVAVYYNGLQIDELKKQTATQIEAIKISQEKKPVLNVVVNPHGLVKQEKTISVTAIGGQNGTVTYQAQNVTTKSGTLAFRENEAARFDLVISNVGSNVAFIDRFTVDIFPSGGEIPAISLPQIPVKQLLKLDGDSLILPVSFTVNKDFAPSGKIVFTVYPDSALPSTVTLDYDYYSQ
jgi:hypothetical protein